MVELEEKPVYFYMNGHDFHISTSSSSESEINLVINRMYVPLKAWGYNNIQWTNFSGEDLELTVYTRIDEKYSGDAVQNEDWVVDGVYDDALAFRILKFWSQNFVPVTINTNIPSFENGRYVIKTFKQSNPVFDFIISEMSLVQYENPTEMHQSYGYYLDNNVDTTALTAAVDEMVNIELHTQTCDCNQYTPALQCTSTVEEDVKIIQQHLLDWGYFPAYTKKTKSVKPTGRYCFTTTQAVMRFQNDCGIPVSGDFTEETRAYFLKRISEG